MKGGGIGSAKTSFSHGLSIYTMIVVQAGVEPCCRDKPCSYSMSD